MLLADFQKRLENDLKKSVKLVLNDNRSTMLSVKWEPNCTKISLHRFFVDAPDSVMRSLVSYIKQEDKRISPGVRSFMEDSLRKLDYSHRIAKTNLQVVGRTYNLKQLFDEVNKEYFGNAIDLNLTWFGRHTHKNRSQLTFGLYHEPLKLIKVHRLLDRPAVPKYFVSFVIYHEMLHHVCPSYFDEKGRHRIHSREFKRRETEFKEYDRAHSWLQQNRERLFMR